VAYERVYPSGDILPFTIGRVEGGLTSAETLSEMAARSATNERSCITEANEIKRDAKRDAKALGA